MPGYETFSLAERPDLEDAFWALEGGWPTFMQKDPVGGQFYGRVFDLYPELHLVVVDATGRAVARLHAVPLSVGIEELPDRGWDAALEGAGKARIDPPWAVVSLIEARVDPALRGGGLSGPLLEEMRRRMAAAGVRHLVGPVRPLRKHLEPDEPIDAYAHRVREDGLPDDPWLRVHARLGGRIVKVAPCSMVVPGTLQDWRDWTGLPFDRSGEVVVPGALNPVHVEVAAGHAVYVEPNVWVVHDL